MQATTLGSDLSRTGITTRKRDHDNQAQNNTMENFRLVFNPKFINTIVARMDANEEIFKKIIDDAEFQEKMADFFVRKVYSRLRSDAKAS